MNEDWKTIADHLPTNPGNPPLAEIAIVALRLAESALQELADTLEAGPCTCTPKKYDYCQACQREDLITDAGHIAYMLDGFRSTIESPMFGRGSSSPLNKVADHLDGDSVTWPAPELLANVVLIITGAAHLVPQNAFGTGPAAFLANITLDDLAGGDDADADSPLILALAR
jgi:hypothetical protein